MRTITARRRERKNPRAIKAYIFTCCHVTSAKTEAGERRKTGRAAAYPAPLGGERRVANQLGLQAETPSDVQGAMP
jgi:hypothetical protein